MQNSQILNPSEPQNKLLSKSSNFLNSQNYILGETLKKELFRKYYFELNKTGINLKHYSDLLISKSHDKILGRILAVLKFLLLTSFFIYNKPEIYNYLISLVITNNYVMFIIIIVLLMLYLVIDVLNFLKYIIVYFVIISINLHIFITALILSILNTYKKYYYIIYNPTVNNDNKNFYFFSENIAENDYCRVIKNNYN